MPMLINCCPCRAHYWHFAREIKSTIGFGPAINVHVHVYVWGFIMHTNLAHNRSGVKNVVSIVLDVSEKKGNVSIQKGASCLPGHDINQTPHN